MLIFFINEIQFLVIKVREVLLLRLFVKVLLFLYMILGVIMPAQNHRIWVMLKTPTQMWHAQQITGTIIGQFREIYLQR